MTTPRPRSQDEGVTQEPSYEGVVPEQSYKVEGKLRRSRASGAVSGNFQETTGRGNLPVQSRLHLAAVAPATAPTDPTAAPVSVPTAAAARTAGTAAARTVAATPVAGAATTRQVTIRLTDATRAGLDAYAQTEGLSLALAAEQLIARALAAHATGAVEGAAAPALAAQIADAVRMGIQAATADLGGRIDRALFEAAAGRLIGSALIMYAYGETEARLAEDACLRVAQRAVAQGAMATLPHGIAR